MDAEYITKIRDKVDEIGLKYGFGEVTVKIEIKNGKPIYICFIESEGRIKLDP